MCDPVTIAAATFAVSAASSVMGFEGETQRAHLNANAANMQGANTYNALEQQRGQIDAQQSENTVSALIERAKARGAISASASSIGTGGSTATALETAADNQAGRALSIENLNSDNQRLQVRNQIQASDIQRQNKINSVLAPSPLSLVLGLAKAGLQSASAFTSAGGSFGGSKPPSFTGG